MLRTDLITSFGLGLVLFWALLLTGLSLYLIFFRRRNFFSEKEYYMLEAEKKANEIIEEASKQAQKILSRAEIEENTLVSKLRVESAKIERALHDDLNKTFSEIKTNTLKRTVETEKSFNNYLKALQGRLERGEKEEGTLVNELALKTRKIEEVYRTELAEVFTRIRSGVEDRITNLETSHTTYIKSLEERLLAGLERNQTNLEKKTDNFFTKSEDFLRKFITDLQSRTETQLDEEIGNAKKIVDKYRQQRVEIIDENVVAILEKTLNIALGKKLTFTEQTELIYEALEQAKKENIFV